MQVSRNCGLTCERDEGMSIWLTEMAGRELLLHHDDRPSDIGAVARNTRVFAIEECGNIEKILVAMFDQFGDGAGEAACPIFMEQAGMRVAA